jgi:uncharacterized protein
MPYGLRDSDLSCIVSAIRQFEEITAAVLFGSRAKGNYQTGSDVDLAIVGDRITYSTVNQLSGWLNEESPLPYYFDIVHYNTLSDAPVREHIDRVGIVIFGASQKTVGPAQVWKGTSYDFQKN